MFWLMFPKSNVTAQDREGKLLDLEQRMSAFLSSRPSRTDHEVKTAVRTQRAAIRAELASQKQWH